MAYILTLGVAQRFRRIGIAQELLKHVINYYELRRLHIQALYLHVITYNDAAAALYEKMHFTLISHQKGFYNINGRSFDSALYAYYRGGPPLACKLRAGLLKAKGSISSYVSRHLYRSSRDRDEPRRQHSSVVGVRVDGNVRTVTTHTQLGEELERKPKHDEDEDDGDGEKNRNAGGAASCHQLST